MLSYRSRWQISALAAAPSPCSSSCSLTSRCGKLWAGGGTPLCRRPAARCLQETDSENQWEQIRKTITKWMSELYFFSPGQGDLWEDRISFQEVCVRTSLEPQKQLFYPWLLAFYFHFKFCYFHFHLQNLGCVSLVVPLPLVHFPSTLVHFSFFFAYDGGGRNPPERYQPTMKCSVSVVKC